MKRIALWILILVVHCSFVWFIVAYANNERTFVFEGEEARGAFAIFGLLLGGVMATLATGAFIIESK